MRRIITLGTALALVFAACGGGSTETTSSTPAVSTTSVPETTPVTTPPTEPEPALQLIAVSRKQVSVLPDGPSLVGGLEATLGLAFDDYAGGIVFSQETSGHQLWHLRTGREKPELLHSSPSDLPFAFLDLVTPAGQPPTALLLVDDSLLLLPVTGGAAEEFPIHVLAGDGTGGDFRTASLGGKMLMVAWSDPDTACITVDLYSLAGDPISIGLFETCTDTTPVMSDEGDVIVTIEVGASASLVIRSTSDGIERDRWQVAGSRGAIHASGGRVAYADGDGLSVISYDGTWEGHPSTHRPDSASISRSTIVLSDLATLGGFAALRGCSSSTHSALAPRDGLTEPAATTRTAIGSAATECDLARLGSLLDVSFESETDPVAMWWESENKGFPVLLEIVNLLETPFAAVEDDDGTLVFVWPAVAAGIDDDEAWEALRSLYNEEDIDRWRSGADPYDRLVIRITEDGRWIQVSSDF